MSQEHQEKSKEQQRNLEDAVADALSIPMFVLSLMFIALFVIELTVRLSPGASRWVTLSASLIWWIFVLEFALRVFLADDRLQYLKRHWLDGIFVLVPVLQVLSIFRVIQAISFLRVVRPGVLAKTFVTTRRGLRQLGSVLGQHSFAYVVVSTILVTLIGALIMFLIERQFPGANILTYGQAVWWAVGSVTTVGTELYPVTAEGRVLATLVMLYGVGIFGYIAGTLATYFIGKATMQQEAPMPKAQEKELQDISDKVDRLLEEHKRWFRRHDVTPRT